LGVWVCRGLVGFGGCGGGSVGGVGGVAGVGGLSKIKHVIVIMQENRSFDHYFGMYRGRMGFLLMGVGIRRCV